MRLKSFNSISGFLSAPVTHAYEIGVELPPGLRALSNIEYPSLPPQILQVPTADGNNDIEHKWYDEEVDRKDKLMTVEVRNDTKDDGKSERNRPEEDRVR